MYSQILEQMRQIKSPEELNSYDLQKSRVQSYQGELVFHNTVPLPEDELPKARETAVKQKEVVLNFFRFHPDKNYTPYEVFDQCAEAMMLLTSIRRSITDLTKEGRLIKCPIEDARKGLYGTLNRTWKYNSEYVKPLNPKE